VLFRSRALIVDTSTGVERGSAVAPYPHGVIETALPGPAKTGPVTPLDYEWALQDPRDYVDAMANAVPAAIEAAGVRADEVVGIGVDFTSCTMLPVDATIRPLCLAPDLAARPHAWVKLWKHHAAQPQAQRIDAIATARGERFLQNCSGRTSSEWLCAKALQVFDEDPAVFRAAYGFVEAGDWLVHALSGVLVRNACAAGYKGFWDRRDGFPSRAFFEALSPGFGAFADKLPGEIVPPGRKAGGLTRAMADRLGLREGTAVASATIDAHSAVPAATVVTPGRMVMVLGTSTCHMLLGDRAHVDGAAGVVWNGIVEGCYGYEAGQAAVGDLFNWFVTIAGKESDFSALEAAAAASGIGARGVLALDWWNGNRSVLMNADLSGLLVGMTLSTTAGDIYRALIEATAFGTRRIIAAFEAHDVDVHELIAVGGLADRSPLLLQIYADVTGRPISRVATQNASALGAAMLGAVAAGESQGGHRSLVDAAAKMARLRPEVVRPDPTAHAFYAARYHDYVALHDHFGQHDPAFMSRLRATRAVCSG